MSKRAFTGCMPRNEYGCEGIAAIFIMLQRLSTTIRWICLKFKFGFFAQENLEFFWDYIQRFTDIKNRYQTQRGDCFNCGRSPLQRLCYAGHEELHCSICKKLISLYRLMFHLHRLEVNRRQNLIFCLEIRLRNKFRNNLFIKME